MAVFMARAVPRMGARSCFRCLIRTSARIILAVPPTVVACFVKGMPLFALRTIPSVFAMRFVGGHMVCPMSVAVPVMRATFRCSQYLSTVRTITVIFRRTGVADRMPLSATFAIPDVGTGFPDFQNALMFGTIPMTGVVAHKIRSMVRFAVFIIAIPKMRAVYFGFINAFATFSATVTITAVIGTLCRRRRVFLSASGTMPIMLATGTGRFRLAPAGFAVPGAAANNIRRMPIVAGCAPPGVRTIFFGLINLIAPFFIAITASFVAPVGVCVPEVMFRAIPRFILFAVADGVCLRIVRRLASFAVPETVGAFFVKSMRSVALRTIPMRIAVFRIFGDVMCLLLRTIPAVRATFRRGMYPAFDAAIPIAVWTGIF